MEIVRSFIENRIDFDCHQIIVYFHTKNVWQICEARKILTFEFAPPTVAKAVRMIYEYSHW